MVAVLSYRVDRPRHCFFSAQEASRNAHMDDSEKGNVPVVGVDGLLQVAAFVRQLRERQAVEDEGGESVCRGMASMNSPDLGLGDRPRAEPADGGAAARRVGSTDGDRGRIGRR